MRMEYQVDNDEKLVRDEVWIAIRDFFEEFGRVPSVIIANLDNEYIGAQEGTLITSSARGHSIGSSRRGLLT